MKRKASAAWTGGLKEGRGIVSTETGVLHDAPYGLRSRFEDGPGTHPEERLGAAHAGGFSMPLALALEQVGHVAQRIDTTAVVSLDKDGDGFAITTVDLTCRANVPGMVSDAFATIAKASKEGCPVSKVLKAKINLDAQLAS